MTSVLAEQEQTLLIKCTWDGCSRWAFACMDNRPFQQLQGVCYCKYHFLVDNFSRIYQAIRGMPVIVNSGIGNSDGVVARAINDRIVMAQQLDVLAREIKTLRDDEIPPAELATFKQTFKGFINGADDK